MNYIRPIERHEILVSVVYFARSGMFVDKVRVVREFRCRVERGYCVDCDPEYRGQGPRTTPCPEAARHDHEPILEPVMADVLAWIRGLWGSGGQGGMPGGRDELFDGFVYVECQNAVSLPHLAVGPGVWPLAAGVLQALHESNR